MKIFILKYINVITFFICFSVQLFLELIWRNKQISLGLLTEISVYAFIMTGIFYLCDLSNKK